MDFNFILSEKVTQIIVNSLAKQPYEAVIEAMNAVQSQAGEQLKAQADKDTGVK